MNNLQVIKVYADRALSGTSDKRPEFQKMLRDAEHVHKRGALAHLSENLPDNLGLRLIDGVPAIRPLAVPKGAGV